MPVETSAELIRPFRPSRSTNHSDDVGGQERHGADEEEHRLHRCRADMERQEIGYPESDEERQRPDDDRVFQGIQVGLPGDPRAQDVPIVRGDEIRVETGKIVVPEAHDDDRENRQRQEEAEHQRKRSGLQIRCEPAELGARPAFPFRRSGGGKRRRRDVGGAAHAAMNSFQRFTM
jgi:hypothetical protein